MNRLRAVLIGLTVVLLVLSAGALLVRPRLEHSARRGVPAAASTSPAAPVEDSSAASAVSRVVKGNVFAQNRAAPRSRYVPGDAYPAAGVQANPASASTSTEAPGEPILLGTIAGPDGGSALVRFPGSTEPRLLRVGERFNNWRLTRVNARSATLEGPRGAKELPLRVAPPS